jgi:hypothetical protein
MLVVSQPPPLSFLMFLLSDWRGRPVPLPQLLVGEPLARRRREQGGGDFPRPQLRLK